MIFFNKPFLGKIEIRNITRVLKSKILCDGPFQKKVEKIIKKKINSKFVAVTQSCTDALELSALLINIKIGDEVILPSYTFTSTANAFALRGAKLKFCDISEKNLSIDLKKLEKMISKKTKAVVIVHYGGICLNLSNIVKLKKKYKFFLIEDCAHSFLAKNLNNYAGSFGDLATFSFHETKNIVAGQGGVISINNTKLIKKANHLLDKGTNRIDFLKNHKTQCIQETKKLKFYSWVNLGSEFRASEIVSSLIFSQIKQFNKIHVMRKKIWTKYYRYVEKINDKKIQNLKNLNLEGSVFHLFAVLANSERTAKNIREFLQKKKIPATFHYVPLHSSKFGKKYSSKNLTITNKLWKRVIRLPLYPELKDKQINFILKNLKKSINLN